MVEKTHGLLSLLFFFFLNISDSFFSVSIVFINYFQNKEKTSFIRAANNPSVLCTCNKSDT